MFPKSNKGQFTICKGYLFYKEMNTAKIDKKP